jgi:hypothetical protein
VVAVDLDSVPPRLTTGEAAAPARPRHADGRDRFG